MPLKVNIENKATYFNLGDWISYYSYAEFDGKTLDLKYFKKSIKNVIFDDNLLMKGLNCILNENI